MKDVSWGVELFKSEAEAIGLVLNATKCEVISKSNISNLTRTGPLGDFITLPIEESTLLGAPLSRGSALNSGLASKIAKLRTAIGCIGLLPVQEALTILRSSFSTPCLINFLRCSASFDYPLLDEHYVMLREGLSAIVNIRMLDTQWLQPTSQCTCEEWWLADSSYCIACTSSLLGVCCGHFGSPALYPFTLPIVRRQ